MVNTHGLLPSSRLVVEFLPVEGPGRKGGGGGLIPNIGCIWMCGPKGYVFFVFFLPFFAV